MRYAIWIFICCCCAAVHAEDVKDSEPPHEFYLEIGDKKIDIVTGKPFKLDVSKDQDLVLKQKPDRLFERAGISLRFPEGYVYTFKNTSLPMWSLKGDHSLVLINLYKDQSPDAIFPIFVNSIEFQYKNMSKTVDDTETLGSEVLKGKAIEPNIVVTARLIQRTFPIKIGNDTVLLLIQHSRKSDGGLYPDSEALMKVLRETFKIVDKK